MTASKTEIVSATVLITILTTLLGLNIIFYLICKFIKRPRRNSIPVDVKQVKRIKVKSASQISKDFEKEGLKMLMQQLQNSHSRRNSLADTKDLVPSEETEFGSTVHLPNTDVVINVEKESDIQIENSTADAKKETASNSKELKCSTSNKGNNSSKTNIFGKFASSLKTKNNKDPTANKQLKRVNSKKVIKNTTTKKKYMDDLNLEDFSDSDHTKKKSSKRLVKSQGGKSKKKTSLSIPQREQKKTEIDDGKSETIKHESSIEQNNQLTEINLNIQPEELPVEPKELPVENKKDELLLVNIVDTAQDKTSHETKMDEHSSYHDNKKQKELPIVNIDDTTQDRSFKGNEHQDKGFHGNTHINNVVAITLTTEEGFQSKLELGSELDLKHIKDQVKS